MKETIHHVKASTQYKREHKADYGHEKIQILYEDKDIAVILKPSGMLSVPYPGSKARTALDVLEKIMRGRGDWAKNHKPFTVHRLDRDTSGVMMFALNEAVQHKIMANWHTMVTERLYHAVAENPRDPKKTLPDSGLIDDDLAQNARHVGYVPGEDDKAKTTAARTNYKVIERGSTHTLFELELDTGKKNQIRAHLSNKGYPLAGDENYRAKTDPFHRLALHARSLKFIHPVTGEKMRFDIPEPEEWLEYVKKGDRHPQTPVWFKKFKPEPQKNIPLQKTESRKSLRHMNFIERGKHFSK
ncbi:RluA family pseudouridine synthase [Treponema sp.]|uniref:RluA family pseudouridine synthase n=1 Tax=Treponema sp. TaxID=166 RepID=UPI0025ECE97C|nr:RluA family pseudouridine synthase [Treponema sp.]MCR5218031.1 RluA family pseudouridine synthase [Treponema sp.]